MGLFSSKKTTTTTLQSTTAVTVNSAPKNYVTVENTISNSAIDLAINGLKAVAGSFGGNVDAAGKSIGGGIKSAGVNIAAGIIVTGGAIAIFKGSK